MLHRSSVPADCCPPKAPNAASRFHQEVQAPRAPDALRGRAEEGAGDAHVVVVGRANVHHQVEGPCPAMSSVIAAGYMELKSKYKIR